VEASRRCGRETIAAYLVQHDGSKGFEERLRKAIDDLHNQMN
jgi:hypothetical protein